VQLCTRHPSLPSIVRLLSCSLLIEGAIVLLAALLRLWQLDLKPPHFDEGINGWFVDQMRVQSYYKYDPENYHGPLYFYGLFISLSLLGRNLWALRMPAVLSSIASVWVVLRFKRYFGTIAARFAALALALSPGAVFYGRYAIHESWMVLSLLITTWGILGLWKSGARRDLIALISGITLLLLIKETAVIHIACFIIAAGVLAFWERLSPSLPAMPFAGRQWTNRDLMCCCVLSALALIFFYSGTFFNMGGIADFFRAYANWFHTGTGDGGHVKSDYQVDRLNYYWLNLILAALPGQIGKDVGLLNYYWLALMRWYEWPALLGLLYGLRLAFPVRFFGGSMTRYVAVYAIGTFVAYSIVPYKTPWCIISIIWPFALLFGCAVQEGWWIFKKMPGYGESPMGAAITAGILPALLLGVSLCTTFRLNFLHFADPAEPYVYVQTMPEIKIVTEPVLAMAQHDARNYGMVGQILLDSYYPLPWVLGDFTGIGYYDKTNTPSVLDGDFILALTSQQKMVEDHLKGSYLRRRFHLRDSMDECTVWFKESLFHDWFSDPNHGSTDKVDLGSFSAP